MERNLMNKHMNLLGFEVIDKVTKTKGIVTSLCFDLYGCIQATITPKSSKNKRSESYWYDVLRLKVLSKKPVMKRPDFVSGKQARGEQGGFNKATI